MSEGTTPRPTNILDSYCKTAPSEQNALDIFQAEWASKFPPPFDHLKVGGVPLFQDGRIAWALSVLGGAIGKNILELGPLEAGHSYMLERAGAAVVTSIESNSRAYLKCLVVKEIMNLARCRFLHGDFIPYLENSQQKFDLVVASGVLYHMKDPVQLLKLIAGRTDKMFLWTHYYDADIINSKPYLKSKYVSQEMVEVGGKSIPLHRHEYQTMLAEKSFCGGNEAHSKWMTRDGLLHTLQTFGFTKLEFHGETPDHPHGPALSIAATK
jgi:hypothetical protein